MITLIQHTFIICSNYQAQPNQSLKLTENTVGDFAARKKKIFKE